MYIRVLSGYMRIVLLCWLSYGGMYEVRMFV